MARTTQRSRAREDAAKRQAAANSARTKHDQEELETITRYDVAKLRRAEASQNLRAAEHDMACELENLFAMGNPIERVMVLVGEKEKESIRRIRKLGKSSNSSHAVPQTHAPNSTADSADR